ncbi:MAG: hypothetical protein CM15mV143_170 [Caudoviricetes sp.]|nr:MAG: hypothetical protein CM15mV143_170 [Caudoviricetes sp.]
MLKIAKQKFLKMREQIEQCKLKVLDLFSGIGGFSLGLHSTGIFTVKFVEIDKFCQKVLNKNFS